jgi:hypothetical protein
MRRVTALATFSVLASSVYAGDLNPPAGPVGPTMKPLSQVEPRTAIFAHYNAGRRHIPAFRFQNHAIRIVLSDSELPGPGRAGWEYSSLAIMSRWTWRFTITSGIAGVYAASSGGPGVSR